MHHYTENNHFKLSASATPNKGKANCGDHYGFKFLEKEQVLAFAIADGVGSKHHDNIASQTACVSFLTSIKENQHLKKQERLQNALQYADQKVSNPENSRYKGMMCTFIGVLWDLKQNTLYFTNVGDSRLYHYSGEKLIKITTDDKKVVNMRDKSGKLLTQGGSVVFREGITNALGYNGATIRPQLLEFKAGDAIILCTDGMYEITDFENKILECVTSLELEESLNKFVQRNLDSFQDDATILVLQNTKIPRDAIKALSEAVTNSNAFSASGQSHIVIKQFFQSQMITSIKAGSNEHVDKLLECYDIGSTPLSKSFLEEVVQLIKKQSFSHKELNKFLRNQLRLAYT